MVGSCTATSGHSQDFITLTHNLSISKGLHALFSPKMTLHFVLQVSAVEPKLPGTNSRDSYLRRCFIWLLGSIIQLVVIRHSNLLGLYYIKEILQYSSAWLKISVIFWSLFTGSVLPLLWLSVREKKKQVDNWGEGTVTFHHSPLLQQV